MDANTMEESKPKVDYSLKIEQIKSNFRNWNFYEWIVFWVMIPVFLFVVYSLPQPIKDNWFILNTANLGRLHTYFLNAYTHSQLYPHLVGNLAFYFVTILMIFAFEGRRSRFWIVAFGEPT